jgi:hypothetical protein
VQHNGKARFLQLAILLLVVGAQLTTGAQNNFQWQDASGNTHNRSDLKAILEKHKQWRMSDRKSGVQANLAGANLTDADLHDVDLSGAELTHANLSLANLTDATLMGANLSEADLVSANLKRARLTDANVTDANLLNANLTEAILMGTNLNGAVLLFADLRGVVLLNVDLSGAQVLEANLERACFEPKSLPELRGIAAARNLELLTYLTNPDALVQLRKQFEDGGFRDQERKITYALKRREADLSCEACRLRLPGNILATCLSWILNQVFFDWTCQYGMNPGRPLILVLLVWLLCSLLYFGLVHTSGHAALYRVYGTTIGEAPKARTGIRRILPAKIGQTTGPRRFIQLFWREWSLLRTSMFFSLMSAFNIGFRDINFGRWLRLLTRREFDIKAVGWARVVAGWQSLISVYLIALWVLTYFGRPFQ